MKVDYSERAGRTLDGLTPQLLKAVYKQRVAWTCSLGPRLLVVFGGRAAEFRRQVRCRYRCATG